MVPRRLKLSPEQNAVLRLLEEAGSETIGAILNTLEIKPTGSGSVPTEFRTSIEDLERLGLVVWEAPKGDPMSDVAFTARTGWEARSNLETSVELTLTREGAAALVR